GCRSDPNYPECGTVSRAEEGVLQAHRRRYAYAVECAAAGRGDQPGGGREGKLVVRWRHCAIRNLTAWRSALILNLRRGGICLCMLAGLECGGRGTMPKPIGLIVAATAILGFPVFVSPVLAATCPPPLAQAKRLILVATQSMDTPFATLQLFRRASADMPWKRVSAVEPAVVGKAGLGWGYPFLDAKEAEEPEKVEGDNRTPAGFFPSERASVLRLRGGPATSSSSPMRPSAWRIPPRLFTTRSPSALTSVRCRRTTCVAVR